MRVVRKKSAHLVRVGGEQHSGWLPAGVARPLPTPVRDVLFDVEIQDTGAGFLLCYVSHDGSLYGDTWHETLSQAEQVAQEDFGLGRDDWGEVVDET